MSDKTDYQDPDPDLFETEHRLPPELRDDVEDDHITVTCRHCGDSVEGPTAAMALKRLGKHASEEYRG